MSVPAERAGPLDLEPCRMAARRIPDDIVDRLRQRLEKHVAESWPSCAGTKVRKRGQFVYVDAQREGDPEPEPLLRLGYTGSLDAWSFAYYTWAREGYEPSFLASGSNVGTPEECFDAAAFVMLQ